MSGRQRHGAGLAEPCCSLTQGAAPASPTHTESPSQPREEQLPTPSRVGTQTHGTHATLTGGPHHPTGVLLEYRFLLVHQGAAAGPHGGILGRKSPFRAGQGWAPHRAPNPTLQDRAEPAGAASHTRPSENVVLERRGRVRLEEAGPAGAATCFPGMALSREFLLWRKLKGLSQATSTAGRASAGQEVPLELPVAAGELRTRLPRDQPEEPASPH